MDMTTREASDIQEKRIAKHLKSLGCRQVVGSGSSDWQKGDCKTEDLFIEAKTNMTDRKSFSVKREWLEKAKEQAFAMRKYLYVLVFSFGDGKDWYTLDANTFKEFYRCYKIVEELDKELMDVRDDFSYSVKDLKELLR